MPVRGPLGLVGRVVEVGRISARVLLVLDANSIVPARRASDGYSPDNSWRDEMSAFAEDAGL